MTVSVALCTYNGAAYIKKQLCSILNQSVLVDEIIICDDCSSDSTIDIIKSLRQTTEIPIILVKNEQNIGVCKNFEKACFLCHGDVILLSDQDDIWLPTKVENVIEWFSKNPLKDVAFSNGIIINENGDSIGKTLWEVVGFRFFEKRDFDKGFAFEIVGAKCRCTGATMAIRKRFLFDFSRYCTPEILHDTVLVVKASLENKLGYMDANLMYYRLHRKQQAGVGVLTVKTKKTSKYEVNCRGNVYITFPMLKEYKKRALLFALRANVPKNAIKKIYVYIQVYHLNGILFWFYDVCKVIKGLAK